MLNIKALTALGVLALMSACTDDSESSTNSQVSDGACNGAVVTSLSRAYVLGGEKLLIDEKDNIVRTFDGDYFGLYYPENGEIITGDAQTYTGGVDKASLPLCEVNATVDPGTGEIIMDISSSAEQAPNSSADFDPNTGDEGGEKVNSSSSVPVTPGSSVNQQNPASATSSVGGDTPVSAASSAGGDTPASSSAAEPASSSVELDANGFPTLESYGPPSPEYTKDISNSGKRGWNTRYWDACKPHCSWISDGQEGKTDTTTEESYQKGLTTARNCNIHDVEVPTFTLGSAVATYWFGYEGTNNACQKGASGVFTCTDMAPIAVNDTLSYGYVAGTAEGKCGKCYHLQYDGHFKDEMDSNKPKETHLALKGKHMIVMASNIGHDVGGATGDLNAGQFDLMVPGGGVGAFDALSTQVNGAGINWGAGFGGFLTECQNGQRCGYESGKECYQTCIKEMCEAAFGSAGFPNLLRGCNWFADWYMAADNPTYYIEEVECPQYLLDHYLTRFNTTKDNNWKWHDDWSTFKQGDVLDTLECWKDGGNPNDPNGKGAGCNSGK